MVSQCTRTRTHTGDPVPEHHSSDLQYKSSVQMKCKQTNKQTNTDLSVEMLVSSKSEFYKWQRWKSTVRVAQLGSYSHHCMCYRLTQKHLRFRYENKTNGRMGGVPSTSRLALAVRNQEFECMNQ